MSSESNNKDSPVIYAQCQTSHYRSFYSIFHTIIALFAIFLSFKCNNGFNLPDFLLACCCPVLYILYKFAVSPNFCELTGISIPASGFKVT